MTAIGAVNPTAVGALVMMVEKFDPKARTPASVRGMKSLGTKAPVRPRTQAPFVACDARASDTGHPINESNNVVAPIYFSSRGARDLTNARKNNAGAGSRRSAVGSR